MKKFTFLLAALLALASTPIPADASTYGQFVTSIKSVQYGSININGSSTSVTATITSVNTAKAVVGYLGATVGAGSPTGPTDYFTSVTLTNATTVTAARAGSTNLTGIIVQFVVVEYN